MFFKMEFKEYVQIVKKRKSLFFVLWLIGLLVILIVFVLLPVRYEAIMSVEVTRDSSSEKTSEYDYDLYYRLEADDIFGKTVVQWFNDESVLNRVKARLEKKKKINEIAWKKVVKTFRGEQYSANYIKVKYKTDSIDQAKNISHELIEVISEKK